MEKVRNLAEIAPSIGFTEFDFYDLYRSTFEKSELGRIKRLLPLRHPYGERGAVGEKDTAAGSVGSGLDLKQENEVVLFWDCYILTYEK